MEKHKTKKAKTLQITYPIPYTQSWPNAERASKHKKKAILRNDQKKHPPLPPQRCWPCPPRARMPDPTVPHLKYGIFHKKTSLAREQSKTATTKPSKQPSPPDNSVNKERKKRTNTGQQAETPMFVFRAIDKGSTRQLSLSETMHVDVKPRRFLPSSPLQRNISPNSTAKVRRNT